MWQRLILLLCFTPLGACDCGSSAKSPLVVSDSFIELGALGTSNAVVERMHDYVPSAGVILYIKSRDMFVDMRDVDILVDDGDDVVEIVDEYLEEKYFEAAKVRLNIVTKRVGTAELGFYVNNEKIDQRTIRVVEPAGLRLDVPVALPTIPNPSLDPAALYVGEQGADLLVSFVTENGGRAYGLHYAKLPGTSPISIDHRVVRGANRAVWDVLVIPPGQVDATTAVLGEHGTIGTVNVHFVPEADIASLSFVKRESLAEFLQRHIDVEFPQPLLDALAQSDDPRWLCQDEDCVAKVEAKDADGHLVLGAPIRFDAIREEASAFDETEIGDLVSYEREFLEELPVNVSINAHRERVTLESNYFWVRSSTSVPESCDTGLRGSGALALIALMSRARLRRQMRQMR